MKAITYIYIAGTLLVTSGGGCNDYEMEEKKLPLDRNSQAADGVPPVPALVAPPASVDQRPRAPELCTWAASMDAIVLGELVDVRLASSPAIERIPDYDLPSDERWRYVQDCPNSSPALVLEVEVEQAIRGDVEGTIEVWIGQTTRSIFAPRPAPAEDGLIEWRGPQNEGQPLRRGQPIGLALHHVEEEAVWTMMDEALFSLDADERIVFQNRIGVTPEPAEAAGLSRLSFEKLVSSCAPTSESENRKAGITQRIAAGPPHRYRAALCYSEPARGPHSDEECREDQDCESPLVCITGNCESLETAPGGGTGVF